MLDDISPVEAGLSEKRLGRVSEWLLDQTKRIACRDVVFW